MTKQEGDKMHAEIDLWKSFYKAEKAAQALDNGGNFEQAEQYANSCIASKEFLVEIEAAK